MPALLLAAGLAAIVVLALSRDARAMVAALIAQIGVWLIWAAQHAAPEIAAEVTQSIVGTLQKAKPTLLAAAAVMLQEVTGEELDPTQAFAIDAIIEGKPHAATSFRPVLQKLLDTVAPHEDITPESAQANMFGMFDIILGAGIQTWAVELVADLLSLGHLPAFAQFHETVIGGLGLSRLTRQLWRAPVNEAITKPLTVKYARLYRQTIPTPGEAVQGWQRGVYDDEAFLDIMASHGYSYARAIELLNVQEKRLTTAEGADLLRAGRIDGDTFRRIVKEQGYGETRTDLVLAREGDAETKTLLRGLADLARRLYRAGDVTEDELRQFLTEARYTDPEVELVLSHEQLALREEKALPVATWLEAYQEAVIDDVQLRGELRRQHYSDVAIDILLTVRTKKLAPAQVVDAWMRGRITRPEAERRLARLGYTADDIPILLDLRARTLTEGQVLDALSRGLINPETARAQLQQLGYSQEVVDVLLAFQRKTLSPADVQAAILRGLISVGDATNRLVQSGYSRPDAELIVELRFRLLSAGQVLDAYGAAQLDRPEALADLQMRGLTREDAERVLAVFDAKHTAAAAHRAPRKPPGP